jgi:hypothetical protein
MGLSQVVLESAASARIWQVMVTSVRAGLTFHLTRRISTHVGRGFMRRRKTRSWNALLVPLRPSVSVGSRGSDGSLAR